MRKICSFAIVAAALALLISQPLAGSAATIPQVGTPSVTTPAAGVPAVTTPAAGVPAVTTPHAAVPSVTVPAATTPQVTTPQVTTPQATTPVGPTPTATVPSATVPSATTPAVHTPSVSTPSVHTPTVATPVGTAPSVTTPSLKAPSLPVASSGSSSSATPGTSATAPATGSAGQRTTSPASGAIASSPRAHRAAASAPASSIGERRSHRGASQRTRRALQRSENRRLRDLVAHDRGCLGSLDRRSQRLLSLRAGLHGAPRSASAVARILHVGLGREQLLERMSLLALQTTASAGCGASTVSSAPMPGPAQLTSAAPWTTSGSGELVSRAAGSSPATPASLAGSRSTPSRPHVRSGGSRSVSPIVVAPSATRTVERASTGQDSVGWPEIVLFAVLAVAVSLVLAPGVRRRLLPALAGVSAADGVGPASAAVASVATPTAPTEPAAATPAPTEPAAAAPAPAPAAAPPAQPEPDRPAVEPRPAAQRQPQPSWMREHAAQGALVATVLAGGLVRILKRGRRR